LKTSWIGNNLIENGIRPTAVGKNWLFFGGEDEAAYVANFTESLQTAASNRIHALADQFFSGFLNASKCALTPFTDASLEHERALQRPRDRPSPARQSSQPPPPPPELVPPAVAAKTVMRKQSPALNGSVRTPPQPN
jgi:hypothetical protein